MNSLRAQLTWRLVIGGSLLLGAASAGLHWQVRHALTAEFDASLRATAQSLATLAEQSHGKVVLEYAGEDMPQFERANGADVFLLSAAANGREIQRSRSLGTADLPLRAGTPEAPDFFDHRLPDGREVRCAGVRFTVRDEEGKAKKRGTVNIEAVLVAGRDRAPLDRTLAMLRTGLMLVGVATLGALAMLVNWGVRGALKPLDRLGVQVAGVHAASLVTRFPVGPLPVELQPIARHLNDLFARLEAAFARERRFTATAAHELRTPLAELRALAEVNLTTPATEAERAESWRDALAATLRMESLALRLLELARAEHRAGTIRREPVALAAALDAAWQPCAARARARGIAWNAMVPPALAVASDPALLGVILGNLCSNAADHAPAGTEVRVTATSANDALTLFFRNRAGDITAADLPHLFERFWRKDAARSDATHHGLGLALAAESATLVGGSLTAQLDTGSDLEFALRLPVHSAIAAPPAGTAAPGRGATPAPELIPAAAD